MRLWDFMGMRLGSFVEDGQFLMLFMVALLLLWLLEDKNRKEFREFSFVMLILLLCPVSAGLMMLYQTRFYSYEDLWELLPVTGLLAYALVLSLNKMKAVYLRDYGQWKAVVPKRRETVYEVFTTAILVVLLFLCGTLTPAKAVTDTAFGAGKISEKEKAVLSALELSEGEQIMLLAPDEIATWARIYSGNIILPYGRNMWEPALSAYTYDTYPADVEELHDWINGELTVLQVLIEEGKAAGTDGRDVSEEAVRLEETYLSRCATYGYDYLVFSGERLSGDMGTTLQTALKRQKDYAVFEVCEGYCIYKLQ